MKKETLGPLFGAALLLAWWGYGIRSDYTWADLIIEKEQQEGWLVAQTQANYSDLARVWTLFKTPVTSVSFYRPSDLADLNEKFVRARILFVRYEDYSKTVRHEEDVLSDCHTKRLAVLDKENPQQVMWSDTGGYGQQLATFLCDKASPTT